MDEATQLAWVGRGEKWAGSTRLAGPAEAAILQGDAGGTEEEGAKGERHWALQVLQGDGEPPGSRVTRKEADKGWKPCGASGPGEAAAKPEGTASLGGGTSEKTFLPTTHGGPSTQDSSAHLSQVRIFRQEAQYGAK